MNEFLEQLVRVLTNAYSRCQECLVSVYHLAPKISEAFTSSLLLGANAIKATTLDPSDWWCSVSLPISVFFTHSLLVVLRKGQTTSLNAAALQPVSKTTTPTANFCAQIILDPYRRPLTLIFLLISTRGLFQDMMFERLHNSTFSEDASEVIVQPLPCGTEKANSVARVVVKLTPRLCNWCASYTLVHSGGPGLRILGRILDQLLANKILAPRWWSNQPNT